MKIITQLSDWLQFINKWADSLVTNGHAPSRSATVVNSVESNEDVLALLRENTADVIFWGSITLTIIAGVFLISVTRQIESWLDPLLHRIKKFAPFVMQITLGAALLLSAFYGALFGPQLALGALFGAKAGLIQLGMFLVGIMLLAGLLPRLAAFGVILLFIPALVENSFFALTHAIYLGEAVTIFLLGGAYQLVQSHLKPFVRLERSLELHLHKYKFILLRLFLGLSLITTGVYILYARSGPALEAITAYGLPTALSVPAGFILLAFFIGEILFGLFFMIGFEVRFAALAYLFFLGLSVLFLGEAVWPHLALAGTCVSMITHGYDRYTIGGRLFARGNLEPIL